MTSYDRHASHDSPYRTGQHMPLNQSRHAPLTSVATSALESRADLSSPYPDTAEQNGWASPRGASTPTTPYSPGLRSTQVLRRTETSESLDSVNPGEIQMQSFQEGLPPPPPVSHSWKRIDRWAEDNYEELYDQLGEGCTNNDVNELEHQLDCSLPIEVRESLQCHDGQERGGQPTGIIFGCMLLDCEEIVQEWQNWKTVNEEYLSHVPAHGIGAPKAYASSSRDTSSQGPNPFWRQELLDKQDSQPPRAIQKAYAHPGWVPLARDWGGNNLAVDLAPGPAGKWGQIIIFGRDYDCKVVVARSWAAFLAMVADDIGSDKVFVNEETMELKLREFKQQGVEPGYMDILRWRMDQKYGRRIPKKKAPNGVVPGARRGSPYGSPTEERGRSPNRFPSRGPGSNSPRTSSGAVSSPLAREQQQQQPEDIVRPIAVRTDVGLSRKLESKVAELSKQEKLVEAPTPTVPADAKKGELLSNTMSPVAENLNDDKKDDNAGLGVDGLDEMKNVAI
jgi:cell wall assembly regulator SMI1